MNHQTLRVLLVRPEREPVMVDIEDSLEGMQAAVGGPIEMVKPWSEDIALVCHEEGQLQGLAPNRLLLKESGDGYGLICGTFFLCLAPRNSERFLSLPAMFADRYERYMVPVEVKD